jgi:hypothetical protein
MTTVAMLSCPLAAGFSSQRLWHFHAYCSRNATDSDFWIGVMM